MTDDRMRFLLTKAIAYFEEECLGMCWEYGHGPSSGDPIDDKSAAWCLGYDEDEIAIYREIKTVVADGE